MDPDLVRLARDWGISLEGATGFMPEAWKHNFNLACDAQPTLVSTPSGAIPALLTTFIDPDILRILTAKNKAAEIFTEVRKGTWVYQTTMFPVVEQTGEVSSYGDFNENGRAGVNINWPQRQSYDYQIYVEYGDKEMERAGLSKINLASEQRSAAVNILNKFQNLTYFYGVQGLQNYGILNDPSLAPAIAPSLKAYGNNRWITSGSITASPNEILVDVQALIVTLVNQSAANINEESPLTLTMSGKTKVALTATNTFGVNVLDMLKKNYPNLKIVDAIQYGAQSAQNPQGSAVGEVVQLIADEVEGQKTGYVAFNEKLRAFPIIRHASSFRQKMTQGTWGFINRQPFAIATMIGV